MSKGIGKVDKTPVAFSTPFDNSTNGFTADNVQEAIEEARGDIDELESVDIVNTNPITITTSWQDVPLNDERVKDSIFTHSSNSAEITVNETSRYLVIYAVGIQSTSGGSRTQTEARLVLNGSPVSNSGAELYNRNSNQGGDNASRSFVLDLTDGDVLKLQVQRQSGGNTQQTIAGQSGLLLVKLAGKTGTKGDKGDTGSGSTINVEDGDILVPNSPFDTLNFGSGLSATDDGGGQVTIEATAQAIKYRQYMQFVKLDPLDFDQYLVSYRDDGDDPRSGNASNGFQFEGASPILSIHDGTINKMNVAIKGVAQSTGSAASTVTVRFELWDVGFNGEGTKLADIDVPIDSSQFTIGNWWDSSIDTDYKGSVSLNIDVNENALLALKFNSRTGNSNAVEIREVVATLTLEED